MPAAGNPLWLVEDIPGVDSVPVIAGQPKKRAQHLVDEPPAVGGSSVRASALDPPFIRNALLEGRVLLGHRPYSRLAKLIVSKHRHQADRTWPFALRCEALQHSLEVFLELPGQRRRIKPPAGPLGRRIQLRRVRASAIGETVPEDEPAHDANPDRGQVLQVLADVGDPIPVLATAPPGRGKPKVPAISEPRIVHSSIHGLSLNRHLYLASACQSASKPPAKLPVSTDACARPGPPTRTGPPPAERYPVPSGRC